MRVLVCGDRNWNDDDAIRRELNRVLADYVGESVIVIEGEARGADSIGRVVAEDLGIDVKKFPADWEKYGNAAGPIRNQQMLDEGKPTYVLAFHNDITHSKGTADMVLRARKAGIPVKVVKV
jgi:hypothetical protein